MRTRRNSVFKRIFGSLVAKLISCAAVIYIMVMVANAGMMNFQTFLLLFAFFLMFAYGALSQYVKQRKEDNTDETVVYDDDDEDYDEDEDDDKLP